MTDSIPVLSEEEIARITPRNCGARDVERMLVTIAHLTDRQRYCICTDTQLCAHHSAKFLWPLENRITELESRLSHAQQCRESEVADLMRQRESKLREAEERTTDYRRMLDEERAQWRQRVADLAAVADSFPRWCADKIRATLQDAKER